MMSVEQEAHAGMFMRRALEFILAGATLLLGLGFLLLEGAWTHPVYALMGQIAPQNVWGTLFTVLGTTRCIVLVINGFWPLSPVARLSLAIATLTIVWLPLAGTFLAYFRLFLLREGQGGFLPDLIMVGIAVMTEALCMYALAALKAAQKHAVG